MREHWKRLFPLAALLLALLAPHCRAVQPQVRGVWVSTVLNLDYPSAQGLDKAALQQELDQVLDTAEAAGFNAVFFQVRPCADSFYPSQIFPYSVYLTGQQGQSPDGAFDPLAYLVEQAHARQMQVHAWINPYRVTQKQPRFAGGRPEPAGPVAPGPADPSLVRLCQGNLFFDPGLPQVRELIVAGAREIVQAYPVDGIHLDDYFYPSTEFDDAQTYAQYGGGLSLDDFRRQSVDQLIQELGQAVHEARPGCLFGVLPRRHLGQRLLFGRRQGHPGAMRAIFSSTPTAANGCSRAGWITSPLSSTGIPASRKRIFPSCRIGGAA